MLNWLDPSFSAVSLALQVTVVVPTGNLLPDITTLPESSSHMMLAGRIEPSTISTADGNGDQVTLASAIPGSTLIDGILLGAVITGPSLSALTKQI